MDRLGLNGAIVQPGDVHAPALRANCSALLILPRGTDRGGGNAATRGRGTPAFPPRASGTVVHGACDGARQCAFHPAP